MATFLLASRQGSSKLNAGTRLILTLSERSPISFSHLSPSHRNIRLKTSEDPKPSNPTSSTPTYNSNLIQCASPRPHLLRTQEPIQSSPALRDALSLLHVWANQRGYSPGPSDRGCIVAFERRGFFWTTVMFAVILGEEDHSQNRAGKKRTTLRKGVGKGLSSYQLFRAALDFFCKQICDIFRCVVSAEPKPFVRSETRFL